LLGLVLFVSSIAFGAQPKADTAQESSARARFAKATKAYNLGEFEEALKEYKQVYELKPHPAFLFNIAQCYRQLGDYSTAAFYYRRYRNEARLNNSDAQVVSGLISEVEAKQAEREEQQRAEAQAARQRELELARAALLNVEASERRSAGELVGSADHPTPRGNNSLFKKWWFWTAAGVIVTSAAIYYSVPLHPRGTSLGEISTRTAR
jgi:tetratricopeptide (TPR) repeat protein